jgi:hypothetical protein
MKHINKLRLTFFSLIFLAPNLLAATLLNFDKYNLSVVLDGKNIYGYYVGQSKKNMGSDNKAIFTDCHFFFKSITASSPKKIRAFKRPMKTWDSSPYNANGEIEIDKKLWFIEFDAKPSNCFDEREMADFFIAPLGAEEVNKIGALDRFNRKDRGAKFTLINSTPAVGIRWTIERSVVFSVDKGEFNRTTDFIDPGQPLTLIKIKAGYSFVRHVSSIDGKLTNGWIKSTGLNDPFPRY